MNISTKLRSVWFWIAIFLILLIPPLAAQQKPRVAVQTIKTNDVAKATAAVCRSFVEIALMKTEVFSIINTADMDEVLKAQELSLADCTDESCAIQIGKLLSAEQIVIGDLSAVGSRMALTLRLLDVSTGKVLRAELVQIDSQRDMRYGIESSWRCSTTYSADLRIAAARSCSAKGKRPSSSSL